MLRTLVLPFVVALAAEAAPRVRAVSQPPAGLAITGELTTADPLFGPTYLFENLPRVATGGGISLVVWNNGQKAARLDANGRMLDVSPLAVLPTSFFAMSDVVFHEGAFTFVSVTLVSSGFYELVLVRITPAGEISTWPIDTANAVNATALATNGRELLLAAATPAGIDTYLIAADAVTVGPRLAGERPKVASDGNDFLAVTRSGDSYWATRILPDGIAGEPLPLALPDAQDLLWNGGEYVVLGLVTDVLRGVRVSATGLPGDAFLEIPVGASTLFPSFSWTGSEYRVLWKQRGAPAGTATVYETWVARAGANGHVLESVRLRESADVFGRRPNIGTTDIAGPVMVWAESLDTGSAPVSNIFAAAGIGGPVEVVSLRANDQYQSAVAQNGAATLVVSTDIRRALGDRGSVRLSIARIAGDGTRAPGPGTILFPTRGAQDFPDAAWNGVDTWIVWRETGGAFAARVDANGTLLDREPIQVSSGVLRAWPVIACGPADCLVVWSDATTGESPSVRSMRLAPNGARLDAQPVDHGPGSVTDVVRAGDDYAFTAIANDGLRLVRLRGGSSLIASGPMYDASLAWSGREFLVTWSFDALRYAVADAAGQLLTGPRTLGSGLFSSAVWTGRHFLVAWNAVTDSTIAGARISRGGVVVDAFPLVTSPGNYSDAELAMRDDGSFVVSFSRAYAGPPFWSSQRNLVRFGRD